MLKWLWRLIYGEPSPDRTQVLLEILIQNQEKTTQAVMNAVAQIGEASQKQADVLNSYLKLFQTPGEPQHWEQDEFDAERNEADLIKQGYPVKGTEAEQAEWVLGHLGAM